MLKKYRNVSAMEPFVVDLISVHRKMLEELQYKNREFNNSKKY